MERHLIFGTPSIDTTMAAFEVLKNSPYNSSIQKWGDIQIKRVYVDTVPQWLMYLVGEYIPPEILAGIVHHLHAWWTESRKQNESADN